jgi:hypothetical protein
MLCWGWVSLLEITFKYLALSCETHIFTIDFTATFHPHFTWVGELRNTPHPSTPAHLGGGNYVTPPAHLGGGNYVIPPPH